ncbi:hypothetical protein ACFWOL_12425 [Streptomyces sp. NPDC058442]
MTAREPARQPEILPDAPRTAGGKIPVGGTVFPRRGTADGTSGDDRW